MDGVFRRLTLTLGGAVGAPGAFCLHAETILQKQNSAHEYVDEYVGACACVCCPQVVGS